VTFSYGRSSPVSPGDVRSGCLVVAGCYGLGVAWRNRRYDRGLDRTSVEAAVISVGNVTAGGTGKTPLVIAVARLLAERGRNVAVVSRGYKAPPGQRADELALISRHLPGIVCMGDPNRPRAARVLVDRHGVDAIVLDDAFQHRRLARDLDIVTVDATCPLGYGHLLPRGLLREPPTALRRADLIVVTRADQVDEQSLQALHARLEEIAPQVRRINARHRPAGLVELDGHEAISTLVTGGRTSEQPTENIDSASRVFVFSAIGNPAAFEKTVLELGAHVCGQLRFGDHHRYELADLVRLANQAKRCGAELLLTTEKDAVKIAALSFDWPCRIAALRIEIEFLEEGCGILQEMLERALAASEAA
jgi:tetraacyldisaccharide 4'-kinase